MKKIKMLSFVFIISLASSGTPIQGASFDNQRPQWRQFFQQYVASVGIGTLIGVSTDVFTEYCFETMVSDGCKKKTTIQELILYLVQISIKSRLLKEVARDMRRYNIPYKESLMWWVTYLTPFRSIVKDFYCYSKKHY